MVRAAAHEKIARVEEKEQVCIFYLMILGQLVQSKIQGVSFPLGDINLTRREWFLASLSNSGWSRQLRLNCVLPSIRI